MVKLKCPNCKILLKTVEETKIPYYECDKCSLKIKTRYSGHDMTEEELLLLTQEGKTNSITFKSRDGNPFDTYLAIINNKVDYGFNVVRTETNADDYPNIPISNKDSDIKINTINVRVESGTPGSVFFEILNLPKYFAQKINFGLASSRECECLACITAAHYIKWAIKDVERISIHFSANNPEFVNYFLKEMKPRDKEMQNLIYYAWNYLEQFKGWTADLSHKKKQILEGGNTSDTFPRGVFPWLDVSVIEGDDYIGIKLPWNPIVTRQFKASFKNAEFKGNPADDKESVFYTLPIAADKALRAWIAIVKSQ